MRCPYCGNENPGDHRFCGMCGRPLVEAPPAPNAARPEPVRRPESEPATPAPAYTGGLFNLNAPADKAQNNLDYLLEDDEERKSNKGLILLTLVALVLVVGLGWLRWRNGGLPFLKSLTASTSQPKPSNSTDSPGAATSSPPADQQNPGQGSTSPDAPTGSTSESTPPQPNATAPPSSNPAPASSSAPTDGSAAPAPSTETPAPASTPPATSGPDAASPNATADKSPDKAPAAPAASTPAPEPAPAAKPKAPAKPAPKPAAKATDPVVIGERYLYGREGFPQNCERGLHYVKPAADQSNPKAMITMGALYATGHCLSRDLPTAYRFFALALRGDPENGPLRQNAEMVWKQMTAEERKQAIRMTQ